MAHVIVVLSRNSNTSINTINKDFFDLMAASPYGPYYHFAICSSNEYVVVYRPDDGNLNYGEIHMEWVDQTDYQNWHNDTAKQSLRTQYEFAFYDSLRNLGWTITRYLAWDESANDTFSRPIAEYPVPPHNLIVDLTYQ